MNEILYSIKIGNIKEFKNCSSKLIIHDGTPIAVFKNGDNFFAIDNRCPHRGASLLNGDINNGVITCPWHGWKFLISSGQALENSNCSVKKFSIYVENDIINLNYDS